MNTQFITPIQMARGISDLDKPAGAEDGSGNMFKSIFESAVNDVDSTQKNLEQKQYLLATGQIDDAHTVPLAASEAQMAVDMLVQLRNKAVESYNELMRINL